MVNKPVSGSCLFCNREVEVDPEGLLVKHYDKVRDRFKVLCLGSGCSADDVCARVTRAEILGGADYGS